MCRRSPSCKVALPTKAVASATGSCYVGRSTWALRMDKPTGEEVKGRAVSQHVSLVEACHETLQAAQLCMRNARLSNMFHPSKHGLAHAWRTTEDKHESVNTSAFDAAKLQKVALLIERRGGDWVGPRKVPVWALGQKKLAALAPYQADFEAPDP